ncbi:Alpha/beta-Hydrolases superfamily protein isoform 1 [Cucumis melo var. makuwa]|uniref:Alpha/beta-Hydrolases superfamily protein isoform 1 n=1 Tax=Cucumis melo var. makuwa TaxID=1194695 RepID=A0A5D3D9C3_CUCMM|nr:Alpha/beta-Hydrolases superfamily protein isoform 1 [Cucumis melo var. makuwa]
MMPLIYSAFTSKNGVGKVSRTNPTPCLIYAMACQRRVVIQNNHGEKLVGILHDTGSDELVIVCHGFRSSKERIPMVNLATAFEKERISAFRFDFAGNGESEGSFQYGNYRRETGDLRSVVQYFHGKEHTVTAIIGHSKGGNVVLLYASKYRDIHTVVNISGRFNLDKGIEGRLGKFEYRVTEESLMDRLTTEVRAACLAIQGDCRVLTVHGSMDKIVPAVDALEFSKSIANHDLCIMEGADHDYTSHQDELALVVVNFVKTNLHLHKDKSELQQCRKLRGSRSRL